MKLNEFIIGYTECALWCSTGMDDDCEYLDEKYDSDDIAPEALKEMEADCAKFITENETALGDYAEKIGTNEYTESEKAGHDFWLTRNGHGAGFWDRDIGEVGDKLTEASEGFGEVGLYVGDDGKVYTG